MFMDGLYLLVFICLWIDIVLLVLRCLWMACLIGTSHVYGWIVLLELHMFMDGLS